MFRRHESLYAGNKPNARRKSTRMSAGTIFFEVKATKTLIILLSVFCVCWSPFFVMTLLSLHSPEVYRGLPRWLSVLLKVVFVHLLPNCNSAFNPIIYTIYNHQFRKATEKLFKHYRRARSGSFTSFSEPLTELRRRNHAACSRTSQTTSSCMREESGI